MVRFARLLAAVAVTCTALGVNMAAATPATERYSEYEQETLDAVLAARRDVLDPHPQGKRIGRVEVVVLDVIEERDPAPGFLNWFHANSREHVIRRELLFKHGQRYRQDLAGETERNLRALRQQSLVIIAPLVSPRSDSVDVVVIVKDVWSLRLNSDYRVQGGALEYLLLQPSEENLAGSHRRLSAQLIYQPDTLAFGARFFEPRLADSRMLALIDGNVIVNHTTGDLEGGFGSFQYGLPLYSTRQRWGWGAVASWSHEVSRSYFGTTLRTFDSTATVGDDAIPYVWNSESIAGRVSVTRSFGVAVKHELRLGVQVERGVYRAAHLGAYDPAAVADFTSAKLPKSETDNGPFIQYHLYLNRFGSLLDAETMSLQESYLLGPEIYLRFYPINKAFASTRNVFGYHGELAYSTRLGNGLARAYLAGTLETAPDASTLYDSLVQAGLRLISPKIGIGRLIYDGAAMYRGNNYSNDLVSLGGEGRLRGYPSGLFLGGSMLASNLELRSRSLPLWTVQLSGALFYDVGDAFDALSELRMKQGAGFGLRLLFPQLERTVMRVDWGFALTPERCRRGDQTVLAACAALPTSPFDGLVLTFRQAFGMPRPTGEAVKITER